MIPARDAKDLPAAVRGAMAAAGFEYLTLRTFESKPGTLGPEAAITVPVRSDLGQASDVASTGELVTSTV